MSQPIFALIDCNNFFVSCERLFRPDLEGKPVVVLSSNDGCVISRSREAKELGIPMGAPAFRYRQQFNTQGVIQFSANFELYGDISERIIKIYTSITPRTEVYSVDEAFLDLSELAVTDYAAWAQMVRQRVWREVGVPVSVGIAPTKTLAKLASDRSKKQASFQGALDLYTLTPSERRLHLEQVPISDIWGIGRRLAPRLRAEGIYTAHDVTEMRPQHAQQLMGIHGRQIVTELRGQACHQLERFGRIRQTVMKGRMFGEDTSDFAVVEAAVASLTARATYAIRKERLVARTASVSLSTNRHKPGYEYRTYTVQLDTPTANTGRITAALLAILRDGFRPGLPYHRANVLLYDLLHEQQLQADLFNRVDSTLHSREHAQMAALDALNRRYGVRTVRFAAEDLSQAWQPRRQLCSPHYTTSWQDLPVARILES
jgi:DNA polymerase V